MNGQNVLNDSHQQVVKKIKQYPTEVNLMVVDAEAEKLFRNRSADIDNRVVILDEVDGPTVAAEGKTCQMSGLTHGRFWCGNNCRALNSPAIIIGSALKSPTIKCQ